MTNIPKFRGKKDRDEWLGGIIENELSRAEGANSDELQANREMAMKYYLAKPRGDEVENRSQVISTDVCDMVNATLAMLVPMLSTDAVVEFEPESEEDEDQVKAESDVVNEIIMERNNGYLEIQEAVKDALLLKNGCMKIFISDDTQVDRLDVEGVAEEQLAAAMMQLQPNQTAELTDDGNTLKVTTTRRHFYVCAVPVENISYQADYVGKFEDIRFFAERIRYTRSDLVDLGVPKSVADSLNATTLANTDTHRARNMVQGEVYDAETRDQDIIDCHEVYIRVDLDRDGHSERYKVLLADERNVLMVEEVDLLPYALGSPFINPHRITGESLFDHLKATQDVKTAYHRQLIDNITTINNGRYAYDPSQTAEEDVLSPKAGGGIRSRNPVQSVVPIMVPDVTSGILAGLQYEDQRRSERGGASLDLLSADAQMVGETAHGIERQYASREALAAMMAKNLSETLIRGIYRLTHEFLRRYSNEPFTVRLNGAYTQVDPSQWPQRHRLNVKTGMSPGQRGHLQQVLAMHMQMQAQAMAQGMMGVLATPETIYRTSQDWLRMAGVDNPERLAVNPASEAAQQAIQAQQQAQQAGQQMQAQLTSMQIELERQKLENERLAKEAEIAWKYYDTNMDAEVKTTTAGAQGVIDLEKQRMSNEASRQAETARGTARATGGAE